MSWTGEFSKLFVDGQWVAPASRRFHDVVSPSTEEIVAQVALASEADMDAAVAAARDAFDHGPWPRMAPEERIAVPRRLLELVREAGVPDGVVNLVPADRAESAYLVAHPGVDKVSFTGSTAAGAQIGAQCGKDFRRYTLELGGKSAAIMLDDADADQFVASTKALSFGYSGQRRNNKTRLLVPRSRAEEVTAKLAGMIGSLVVEDPFDPATEVGPMTTSAHRDRLEGCIKASGARGLRRLRGAQVVRRARRRRRRARVSHARTDFRTEEKRP